jgi:hypothetical protein
MARKKGKAEPPTNGGYPAPPEDWAPRPADGEPPRPEVIEAITQAWEAAVGLPSLGSVAHAIAPDCTALEYGRALRTLKGRYDALTAYALVSVKAAREEEADRVRNSNGRIIRKGETFS